MQKIKVLPLLQEEVSLLNQMIAKIKYKIDMKLNIHDFELTINEKVN